MNEPNDIELMPPTVPKGAREIDERADGVNKVQWFMLKTGSFHFVRVETAEENWMPFGLRVPEKMGQDVYDHPFPAAVRAGAGRIAVSSSKEGPNS